MLPGELVCRREDDARKQDDVRKYGERYWVLNHNSSIPHFDFSCVAKNVHRFPAHCRRDGTGRAEEVHYKSFTALIRG